MRKVRWLGRLLHFDCKIMLISGKSNVVRSNYRRNHKICRYLIIGTIDYFKSPLPRHFHNPIKFRKYHSRKLKLNGWQKIMVEIRTSEPLFKTAKLPSSVERCLSLKGRRSRCQKWISEPSFCMNIIARLHETPGNKQNYQQNITKVLLQKFRIRYNPIHAFLPMTESQRNQPEAGWSIKPREPRKAKWIHITMCFITPLSKFNNENNGVLRVVDVLSKMIIIISTKASPHALKRLCCWTITYTDTMDYQRASSVTEMQSSWGRFVEGFSLY